MNRKNNRVYLPDLCTPVAKNRAPLFAIFCALLLTDYNGGLRNRSVTNSIYELRCKDGKPENGSHWEDIKAHTEDIPEIMKTISKESAAFGTTLWFSDSDKKNKILDKLIACGEYTACYNLLSFLITEHPEKIKQGKEAHYIFTKTLAIWEEFKKNPFCLLEIRKSNF